MFLIALALVGLAALPVALMHRNLRLFQPATGDPQWLHAAAQQPVSVLIPARNEAEGIEASLVSILASHHPQLEVVVMDDDSEDATAAIVERLAARDKRLRLVRSAPLPEGWNGKQHACWQLAEQARHDLLLFLDADVRLDSSAISRIVAEKLRLGVPLLSGFPLQETGTWSERMLIPTMHLLLLGYLPLERMRRSLDPSLAAGCGQLFLCDRASYQACGGHATIRGSRHDGLQLPRAFRRKSLATDIFDASDLATCRMYRSREEVVRGLLKNAHEGIASPKLIGIFSLLLLGGSVLPIPVLVATALTSNRWFSLGLLAMAALLSVQPRRWINRRFYPAPLPLAAQPIAIAWFLGLQWWALLTHRSGQGVLWRGRSS
jgi:glycosyltransferase involved in cell wall biosynthesis